MTERDVNYAKVLQELHLSEESISEARALFQESRELLMALSNPAIKKKEKEAVINRIFCEEIRSFIKVLCDNRYIENIEAIFKAYDLLVLEKSDRISATLSYVTKPSEDQIKGIKQMICKKYNKVDVLLQLNEDKSLMGGFVLKVEDTEYDKSLKGKILDLQKTLLWR
ncbi:MAG: ATP synthase F1 subunit delta [Cellulosilyticum sp.]|nr:ATP synthase F1 subunit delta [Cellulosilyticum sp.]